MENLLDRMIKNNGMAGIHEEEEKDNRLIDDYSDNEDTNLSAIKNMWKPIGQPSLLSSGSHAPISIIDNSGPKDKYSKNGLYKIQTDDHQQRKASA